jgi:hypothetical protein
MNLFWPKSVVLNWYRYDIRLSLELIDAFVKGVEQQASDSISSYQTEKETFIKADGAVDVHEGLDSESWDLELLFTEHFPSLQRRSALITLHSFFETELNKLCRLYKSEKHFRLGVRDLKGKGIDRSMLYLEKVAEINVHKNSPEWAAIRQIRDVRNCIVHGDARVGVTGEASTIINFVSGNEFLTCNDDHELVLQKGFLAYVLKNYEAYFNMMGQSIAEKEKIKAEA